MTDFAAIDFETANEWPSSVCSVGVVVVRGGEIVDSFYSLIHPEPEYYQRFCQRVHGLGPEDTDDAPIFPAVWAQIEPLIKGLPFVAHNSPFDEGCLKAVFRVYRMDYPDYRFLDTLRASRGFPTISSRPSRPPAAMTSPVITTPSPMPKPAPGSPFGSCRAGHNFQFKRGHPLLPGSGRPRYTPKTWPPR